MTAGTAAASTVHHPFGSPSGPGLFRMKGAQLPAYIQNVAHALQRSGSAATESQAIEMAVGIVKRWAAGAGAKGKKVSPDVQAAAARAVAEWTALKTAAHSHANEDGGGMTLTWNGTAVDLASVDLGGYLPPHLPAGTPTGGQFGTASGGQAAAKGPAAAGKAAPAKAATVKAGPAPAKAKAVPAAAKAGAAPAAKAAAAARTAATARKAALHAQASALRVKAAAIEAQITGINKTIAAQVKATAAAKAAAAAKPSVTAKAATAVAKAATTSAAATKAKTASKSAANAKPKPTLAANQATVKTLHSKAHALWSQADTLDAQANAIKLSAGDGSDGAFLDLAFTEALAGRVPPGRPGGGQFTPATASFTRHDTPAQTARAVNALEARQRAMVRATVLVPAGFQWQPGDRLAPAGDEDGAALSRSPAGDVDLAFNPAQRRDAHGRFMSAGGSLARAAKAAGRAAGDAGGQSGGGHSLVPAAVLATERSEHLKDVAQLTSDMRAATAKMTEMQEKGETKKARIKFALHVGVILAGGILAAIEAKLGAPGLVSIASLLGLPVIQELGDLVGKL